MGSDTQAKPTFPRRLGVEHLLTLLEEVKVDPFKIRLGCEVCEREGLNTLEGTYKPSRWCQQHGHIFYVQAMLERRDTHTGQWGTGYGSKYMVSKEMTDGEIVKKCFVAARDYSEHEVREGFTWKGRRILGPHTGIDELWLVAETEEEGE